MLSQRTTPTGATPRKLPLGVAANTAMIEPGAAGDIRPASKMVRVKMPTMPPAIVARIRIGFIST